MRYWILCVCLTALLTSACGKKRTQASAPRSIPARPGGSAVKPGTSEVGMASWYGHPYHGRRAANGEVYDMRKLTAAHRTLPFDTMVNVRNLDNQREVQVRINDRGPFVGGRIIDLSEAAAQQIAMIGPGTAKVSIEVLSTKSAVGLDRYAVQIGAFSDAATAEQLQRRMTVRYGAAYVENVRTNNGMMYRVRVGPKPSLAEAAQLAASLKEETFPALIVRVDSPVRN
ncbi:MAG: septal ring lytic transglycosylase RlpA family protein [Acidobacteria bacterium]|nr:septal ring lytic transglycosylase RlpA family protein [Acidobacteriota bacterium]